MFDEDWKYDNEENYVDDFAERDRISGQIERLLDDVTSIEMTEYLYDYLKVENNPLGCSDDQGNNFFPTFTGGPVYNGDDKFRPIKSYLKKEAKNNNLIVVRNSYDNNVDMIIHFCKVGTFCYQREYYTVVRKSILRQWIDARVRLGDIDIDEYHKKRHSIYSQLWKMINSIENKNLRDALGWLFCGN